MFCSAHVFLREKTVVISPSIPRCLRERGDFSQAQAMGINTEKSIPQSLGFVNVLFCVCFDLCVWFGFVFALYRAGW